jgi:transcriptional regulator with XRE-family HTH domain
MSPITLRLRALRERRRWSQAELARRAGIGQSAISKIEAGKTKGVDLATLDRLARALGVSPRSLIVVSKWR